MFHFNHIQGLSPGSYLVEVDTAEYVYEDIRIDINSKGKHRARRNNPVQPNQVNINFLMVESNNLYNTLNR